MSAMAKQYARRLSISTLAPKAPGDASPVKLAVPQQQGGGGAGGASISPPAGATGPRASPQPAATLQANPQSGMFQTKYVGGGLLPPYTGGVEELRNTLLYASKRLLEHRAGVEPSNVTLVVSPEGIKAVDVLSSEVLTRAATSEIACAMELPEHEVLQTGSATSDTIFVVYVRNDNRLKRTVFELFITVDNSTKLCDTIREAFKAAKEEIARLMNGPFAAISAARDPVTGPLAKRQVQRSDLTPLRVLGAGQFGEVFLASLLVRDKNDATTKVHTAVKMLRNAATAGDRESFLHEAEIMAEFEHENLLRLIGVAVQQRPWLCVLEYMQYGDLRSVLKACDEKGMSLTVLEQLSFCQQIASGMNYLSQHGFIHMDLAARNCLLSQNNSVKIADFGLSRKLEPGKDAFRLSHALRLPVKWLALESLNDMVFSPKSDVWAYAIVAWEVFSYGIMPYPTTRNIEIQDKVSNGLRLVKPDACPLPVFQLLELCWNVQRANRPTFAMLEEVMNLFVKAAERLCPPKRDVGHKLEGWSETTERTRLPDLDTSLFEEILESRPDLPRKDPLPVIMAYSSRYAARSAKRRKSVFLRLDAENDDDADVDVDADDFSMGDEEESQAAAPVTSPTRRVVMVKSVPVPKTKHSVASLLGSSSEDEDASPSSGKTKSGA